MHFNEFNQLTDEFGPDTGTWSMHTVGWLELAETEKAEETYLKMLRNINGDFLVGNFLVIVYIYKSNK